MLKIVILPVPLDRDDSGIALAFFDRSIDTVWGVKLTDGRDMTTSDGDDDDDTVSALISSNKKKRFLY
jgi:hypothetical protein